MTVAPLEEFRRTHANAIRRLHAQVRRERWSLSEPDFAQALHRSAASHFAEEDSPSSGDVERHLASLHVDDLALARACESGNQTAWVDFLARFRPLLYGCARRLVSDEVRARELADSLYAELYGLEEADGRRRSLFRYFHGRSSLDAWLRAVFARSYVNQYRSARRDATLHERAAREPNVANAPAALSPDPDRHRLVQLLQGAFQRALAELDPDERLRLSYYHVQELSLAQVGDLVGEHESTVSRKLERTRRGLRKAIERILQNEHGLTREQTRHCYEYAMEDGALDPARALRASS